MRVWSLIGWLGMLLLTSGCMTASYKRAPMAASELAMPAMADGEAMTPADAGRMLVWKASVALAVDNVSNAVSRVRAVAQKAGGYVESASDRGGEHASLLLRVPSAALKDALGSLEGLGTVTHREVSSEDVTEQYIDVDARVRNLAALRDRLKALLDKATAVKDVLEIEKELTRVQTELDSLQGRLKALKGQVDFASLNVNLSLRHRKVLGPLGYIFKGVFWTVEKLFIISE